MIWSDVAEINELSISRSMLTLQSVSTTVFWFYDTPHFWILNTAMAIKKYVCGYRMHLHYTPCKQQMHKGDKFLNAQRTVHFHAHVHD